MIVQKSKKTEEGLKAALSHLIQAEKSTEIQLFDTLYHKEMQVLMVNVNGEKMLFDKAAFMQLIEARLKEGNIQENSEAQFNHVEIKGDKGHIAITRKINLTGTQNKLMLSIDFVWEDDRWQITREVIFSMPI